MPAFEPFAGDAAIEAPWDLTDAADPALLRLVAMSTNDGIWDWDLATNRVFYSSRWLELIGVRQGGAPDHIDTFLMRLHPGDLDRVRLEIEAYLAGATQDYRIEFRIRHQDGSWRWILSRGIALRDTTGRAYRIAGTHTDITERVQAAERLERLVVERTADLRASRDRAELAAAATAKFLAATSHDIRQPLQAMALLLGGLEQDVTSASGRDTLVAVKRSLLASMELLDGLLEFSRLDAGALRPAITTVDIGALMESIGSAFSSEAAQRGIELTVVASTLTVSSDAQLLGRIVRNLVSNAIKYTERGRVLIGCRRRQGRVHLEVWDTGRGIPPERYRQVFWEFVQLGERRQANGLGLGLAIVERLAKLLDHKVHLRSWPGRGTRFSVEMAVSDRMARAPGPLDVDVRAETPSRRCRVGLLEDNREIATAFRQLFLSWGWSVVHADNLQDLVGALAGVAPDLLIADWHVEGERDGFASFDAPEQLFGRRLPGVVLTGDYDFQALQSANTALRKVLHKPVLPQILLAVLQSELGPIA